jgi:hypothetical protein
MNPAEFLQEDNGGLSSTRLAFLLWVVGVLVVWIVGSLKAGELQSIDNSIITILGILMGGKVVQKFGEKPDVRPSRPAAAKE